MPLAGSLPLLGLFPFLQVVCFRGRSLTLDLDDHGGAGTIWIREGRIHDAESGDRRGVGALFPLLEGGDGGTFAIRPPPEAWGEATITLPLDELLRKIAPRIKEATPEASARIRGEVDAFGLEDLLLGFEAGRRPVLLAVAAADGTQGRLRLAAGGLSAQAAEARGEEALRRLLRGGTLGVEVSPAGEEPEAAMPVGALLEAARREPAPRLRRRAFEEDPAVDPPTVPAAEAAPAVAQPASPAAHASAEAEGETRPKADPQAVLEMIRTGTLREKMALVCGRDAEVALAVVSQSGIPETFILGVAEACAANPVALRHIAGQKQFLRNGMILRALCHNPKMPTPAALPLLNLLRPDEWEKISANRELPEGTRQAARHLADKRAQKARK